MTNKQIPGQMSFENNDNSTDPSVRKDGMPRKLPRVGNRYGESGFEELYDSDEVVDHDKTDTTPPYLEAQRIYEQRQMEEKDNQLLKDEARSEFETVVRALLGISSSELISNLHDYVNRYEAETKKEISEGNSEEFFIEFFSMAMSKLNKVPELTEFLEINIDYRRFIDIRDSFKRYQARQEHLKLMKRPPRY